MRDFNITGLCVPKMHYMVDTTPKIEKIIEMVDKGLYFTINRARQFGKTTTLNFLSKKLSDKYFVADISFEDADSVYFESVELFCKMFIEKLLRSLTNASKEALAVLNNSEPQTMNELGGVITEFCRTAERSVVLMIDEVDQTSNNENFLKFLGMLRNKYLLRNADKDYTFQSVILAGVYDIKNLKRKILGDKKLAETGERTYNSPWNIAADFNVDMSFKPAEIATMLNDYENDKQAEMNIPEISEEIYKHTNGYPFLVSKICKTIDEDLNRDWTENGVKKAVKSMLANNNMLFDDLLKNLESNENLRNLIFAIMFEGKEISFSLANPEIGFGHMLGILASRNGKTAVSNEIFELFISDYFTIKTAVKEAIARKVAKNDIVENGHFNMELCLEKYAKHFYESYNKANEDFLETNGRLLFMTYLKPLINGEGFYHIEPENQDFTRMDLVVDYGNDQFIVELKLWRGEKSHKAAYEQLWKYLDGKGANKGYLLTYDFRQEKNTPKAEWVEYNGKQIFDVIV